MKHQIRPFLIAQIDGKASLSAIAVGVQGHHMIGAMESEQLTTWRLDLEHVGPLLSKHLGGKWSSHYLGEVEDSITMQRTIHEDAP